jgi:hypothetical protein
MTMAAKVPHGARAAGRRKLACQDGDEDGVDASDFEEGQGDEGERPSEVEKRPSVKAARGGHSVARVRACPP